MSLLRVTRLNDVPAGYKIIMALQDALFQQRKLDQIADTMLLLQHSPVYTMGKRGSESDFRTGLDAALAAGVEVAAAPRGGETTYHGPGQLVAYPLLSLRGLKLGARAYVETLEDIMIETAAAYGVTARGRIPGRTGVWVDERKLGAVGVAISGGFTRHGLALNVTTDLEAFSRIVPCGDPLREATSLERETGRAVDLGEAAEAMAAVAARRLGFDGVEWIPDVRQLCAAVTPEG